MNKIILYIAISQDGFIADVNGGVEWLPHPETDQELIDVGYKELMCRIDSILMGSLSYQQILSFGDWRWADKQTYVFTSKSLKSDNSFVQFTNDSPLAFLTEYKNRPSTKDIWLLGGAQLAESFAKEGLIDEIILTVVPKTLGAGIPLSLNFEDFTVNIEKSLMKGLVQKKYLRKE